MNPEDYLRAVCNVINSLRGILSESEIAEVEHLVAHGEPVEGLRALALIIYEEQKNISDNMLASILVLIGDAIPKHHLPPVSDK